jgi:hypothetical protein
MLRNVDCVTSSDGADVYVVVVRHWNMGSNVEVSGLRGFSRRSARLPGWASARKRDRCGQKSALAGRR